MSSITRLQWSYSGLLCFDSVLVSRNSWKNDLVAVSATPGMGTEAWRRFVKKSFISRYWDSEAFIYYFPVCGRLYSTKVLTGITFGAFFKSFLTDFSITSPSGCYGKIYFLRFEMKKEKLILWSAILLIFNCGNFQLNSEGSACYCSCVIFENFRLVRRII